MRERTIRIALNLQQRGFKTGQVFTIMGQNTTNMAPTLFAAYCMGCPVNTLAMSYVKEDIVHMLNITKPSLVLCDVQAYDRMVESLKECAIDVPIITIDGKVGSGEQVDDLLVANGLESTFRCFLIIYLSLD